MAQEKQKVSVSDDVQVTIEQLEPKVKPIIHNVPEMLRKGNRDAYTPHLISIGPMHYKNKRLKPMKEQKILHYDYFLERVETTEVLKDFEEYLKDNEDKIRRCYSEKYLPEKDKFVDIILLDAVFIMELFLKTPTKGGDSRKAEKEDGSGKDKNEDDGEKAEKEDDSGKPEKRDDYGKAEKKDVYIFNKPWIRKEIERDLLLAENQLPFFVLEKLYSNLNNHDQSFVELACNFFYDCNPGPVKSAKDMNHLKKDWDKPEHFTDLIRSFYISKDLHFRDLTCVKDWGKYWNVKDATKLRNAGITFKPKSTDDRCSSHDLKYKCLLGVEFKKEEFLNRLPFLSCLPHLDIVKARLQIPKLKVDDTTEYVLRNLMAFEQCDYPWETYICSYVCLIDMLIGEEKDAAVLLEKGIITNNLSSEKELTVMINNLCKNIVINSHCFGEIPEQLSDHYKNRWNKIVADIRLVYFSNLWKGTGTVVAIVVLVISIFSFIRSNIEYF